MPGPYVPSMIASALIAAHDPDAKILAELAAGVLQMKALWEAPVALEDADAEAKRIASGGANGQVGVWSIHREPWRLRVEAPPALHNAQDLRTNTRGTLSLRHLLSITRADFDDDISTWDTSAVTTM